MRLKNIESRGTKLNEAGVRYGQREKQSVLNSLDNFGFGIEIEMIMTDVDSDSDSDIVDYIIDEDIDIEFDNDEHDIGECLLELYNEYSFMKNSIETALGFNVFSKYAFDIFRDENIFNRILSIEEYRDNKNGDLFSKQLTHGLIYDIVDLATNRGEYSLSYVIEFLKTLHDYNNNYSTWYVFEIKDKNELETFTNNINKFSSLFSHFLEALSDNIVNGDDNIGELDSISDEKIEKMDDILKSIDPSIFDCIRSIKDSYSVVYDNISIDDLLQMVNEYLSDMDVQYIKQAIVILGLEDHFNEILRELYENDRIDLDDIEIDQQSSNFNSVQSVHEILEKDGYLNKFDYKVKPEGDDMVEIISPTVSGDNILELYNDAFKIISYLEDNGLNTGSESGLHMSISYKNGQNSLDKLKFLILSNIYNLLENDKEMIRGYVKNIFEDIEDEARDSINDIIELSLSDTGNNIFNKIITNILVNIPHEKYWSVNFSDYNIHNGRVELRFFGGNDYQLKKDDYFDNLIKCMFALKLGCEPEEKKKEYHSTVWRFLNNFYEKTLGVNILDMIEYTKKYKKLFERYGIYDHLDFETVIDPQKTFGVKDMMDNFVRIYKRDIFKEYPDSKIAKMYSDKLKRKSLMNPDSYEFIKNILTVYNDNR